MPLIVHTIPAFTDNYIWLFHSQGESQAYVVDPGDAAPVLDTLQQLELSLGGILITHHHADHVGGVDQLLKKYSVPVYAPEGIPQATTVMMDGDSLHIANQVFQVLALPGHTLDHIAYFTESEPLIFCGDTLFSNGCGRLFEGTSDQMWHSLSRIASLPCNTKIYCAHEYTEANTRFALAVEPDNNALQQFAREIEILRKNNRPTIPSTLTKELATNPFLRVNQKTVQDTARLHSDQPLLSEAEIFAAIRRWKDSF
jgi:hydroxyacylglutathione hydrolase